MVNFRMPEHWGKNQAVLFIDIINSHCGTTFCDEIALNLSTFTNYSWFNSQHHYSGLAGKLFHYEWPSSALFYELRIKHYLMAVE